ncbi:hypothetical protein BSKO_07824 [Bryopsis sp. KO-2023]|nr:hypothetical protein BSKO_07824 [Bryopsis sp. KO-2023]
MVSNIKEWSALALVATFTALHVTSIGIFAKGFLLTRVELPDVSPCALPDGFDSNSGSPGCWSRPRFEKVVVVIVDALRFDFLVSDGSPGDMMHVGRFPKLLALHEAAGDASVLLRFRADPPTTTMQRVKAMLTGGLPTFLDVGKSFSASAISEDNLLYQVKQNGGKLAFVGDDTWDQLCPDLFDISLPYPSFNVRDLDTVDNGVWENLLPLVKNRTQDWDFLIGHYLGVDHAGHAFGVQTPEMLKKLQQMDDQISEVVEEMTKLAGPNDPHQKTLLLVLGDHGQTLHGDHGGGTKEEVDSGLLAFDLGSMVKQGGSGNTVPDEPGFCSEIADMDQLDFSATLALMLGVPIPYGSVGKVFEPLWGISSSASEDELLQALRVNAHQVHHYLNAYSNIANVNLARLRQLQDKYKEIRDMETSASVEDYVSFLELSAAFAREQWTQFEPVSMVLGLAILGVTLFLQGYIATSVGPKVQSWTFLDGSLLVMCAFHGIALLSNSYIMAEGRITGFWIGTATLLLIRDCLSSKHTIPKTNGGSRRNGNPSAKDSRVEQPSHRPWSTIFCGVLVLGLNVAMEKIGFIDRTGTNPFDKTTQHPGGDTGGWVEITLSHGAIVAIPSILTFREALRGSTSNKVGSIGILSRMSKLALWLEFSCLSAWWLLRDGGVPKEISLGTVVGLSNSGIWGSIFDLPLRLLIPRVIYTLSGSSLVAVLVGRRLSREKFDDPFDFLELFRSIIGCLLAPLLLVSERTGLLVGCLAVLQMGCFFELLKGTIVSPHYLAGMLSLFGMQAFFFTGHFCEFSGLQYNSGFVGFDEFEFFISGCLLALNTFGPQIIVMLATPIGMVGSAARRELVGRKARDDSSQQHISVKNLGSDTRMAVVVLIGIRTYFTFVSMLSAAIQRRHLLVWAIFAPKFVFEVCFLLVLDAGALLLILLLGN